MASQVKVLALQTKMTRKRPSPATFPSTCSLFMTTNSPSTGVKLLPAIRTLIVIVLWALTRTPTFPKANIGPSKKENLFRNRRKIGKMKKRII
jgi:hypothetical protein